MSATLTMTRLPGVHVNFDILCCIMAFLPCADILSFMRCSKALHPRGVMLLLQTYDFDTLPQGRGHAFWNFILADVPFRAGCLRGLPALSPAQSDAMPVFAFSLLHVLSHAHNLQSLALINCEELIRLRPALGDAVCALPGLSSVAFSHVGPRFANVLRRMQTPLRRAHIRLLHPADAYTAPDATDILTGSARTLTYLSMNGRMYSAPTRFDRLTTLQLGTDDLRTIRPLLESFPCVRRLAIDLFDAPGPARTYTIHMTPTEFEEMREDNQVAHEEQKTWQVLEELAGDVRSLYALGLRARAKRLTIDITRSLYEDTTELMGQAQSVFQDTSPLRVKFRLRADEVNLLALLIPLGVYYVEIDIQVAADANGINEDDEGLGYRRTLVKEVMSLSSLTEMPLTHISFCLHGTSADHAMRQVRNALRWMTELQFGTTFLNVVGHLAFVRFYSADIRSAWRVVREGRGKVGLEPLPEEQAFGDWWERLPEELEVVEPDAN